MKALIKSVEFSKSWENKFGETMYSFKIMYDDKTACYNSKSKDQKKFIPGQEAEFTEEKRTSIHGDYLVIKPIYNQGQSNFSKKLKVEQARYSGFAMSYAKDLVKDKIIPIEQMYAEAECMFEWMVTKDKEMSS